MVFLDINTFFSLKAGGIRTYHQAKLDWFARQSAHRYVVVHPGPAYREIKVAPNVSRIEAYGPALTADAAGYRLLLDYWRIWRIIRRERPAVLEAGDAWLTGLFCLALKKSGWYRGVLLSFYHSDPVPSYFIPWSRQGRWRGLKKILATAAGFLFYKLQSGYDCTVVSSRAMEGALRARGLAKLAYLPFGVPAHFLESPLRRPSRTGGPIHLLYAGRLDKEKGMDVLCAALPWMLAQGNLHVTVMGRGACADQFKALAAPNFEFLGFVDQPAKVLEVYDRSDILLAPGPFETFGLGVLEGMARGLMVVGPDRGGTAELLSQAGGQAIFRAGAAADFQRAVGQALESQQDPALRAEASRRSRALAESYGTWHDAIARMVGHHAAMGEAIP